MESQLYRVRKIFDRRTNEKCSESRMYGQAAIPHVPTKKYMEMLKIKDTDRKAFNKWADEASWEDVWERQAELKPIIGMPVYFISVKLDAGYFRCAVVEKFEQDGRSGVITLTTCNSIYEVILDD